MSPAVENTAKETYLRDAAQLAPNGSPAWLKALRQSGLDMFKVTPLPNSRMEEWRQTNIGAINNTEFESVLAPVAHGLSGADISPFFYDNPQWRQLVFVDGFYADELGKGDALPKGAFAGSLKAALAGNQAALIESQLSKPKSAYNAYTALNDAFMQDGALVHVPNGVQLDSTIHLIFISSTARGAKAANIRNLIVLEEGAEAQVVMSFVAQEGNKSAYLNNVVQQVHLGANAGLTLYKLVQEAGAGHQLDTMAIVQERDSRLKTFNASYGGKIVRNQLCVSLEGAGGDCDLTGLYMNDQDRLVDNALNITHHAPNCRSRIGYKGILADKSKAVFLGKVYVHPEAQGTDSDQLSNNLLLSDNATIDSKPQLEIYADDVKCTHGTTVGSPPEEVVFYFRSRGIDEAVARGMLTYGFADEIVEALDIAEVKERLAKLVYAKYSPKEIG